MFWSQVLDELGRGTSTHDGVAVAHATLDYVVSTLKPMCLFVTHYPDVARDITRKHPAHCDVKYPSYVEIDGESDGDDRRIEFLFKLAPGVAHRSYGLNVARMAGLPSDVIARAGERAREMEEAVAARAVMRDIERLGPVAATESSRLAKRACSQRFRLAGVGEGSERERDGRGAPTGGGAPGWPSVL